MYIYVSTNPPEYITRYQARSNALSATCSAGPPLRRPGFGVLVSIALGPRPLSYPTSASVSLTPRPRAATLRLEPI